MTRGAGCGNSARPDLWGAGEATRRSTRPSCNTAVEYSRKHAYALMELAAQFNGQIAERYGSDKLNAIMGYIKATPANERTGDVLATDIALKGADGRFTSKPIHEAGARYPLGDRV